MGKNRRLRSNKKCKNRDGAALSKLFSHFKTPRGGVESNQIFWE